MLSFRLLEFQLGMNMNPRSGDLSNLELALFLCLVGGLAVFSYFIAFLINFLFKLFQLLKK